MLIRRIYFKIKRKVFYWFHGFYPEDLFNLVNSQKILESISRPDVSYKTIFGEVFNAK